jgi:hypothetical protein
MTVSLGVSDLRLAPHDHICAFYRGIEERDEILIPYLREGLRSGDKCICIVDATNPDAVLTSLSASSDIDVRPCLSSSQIDVMTSRDAYLCGGSFSTDAMLQFWERSLSSATGSGSYPFARVVGEMTWALRDLPGSDELVDYEAQLNHLIARHPIVVLCLYDLDRFSGELLVDILKTHPRVLLGGMLVENPYWIMPDEFLAARSKPC